MRGQTHVITGASRPGQKPNNQPQPSIAGGSGELGGPASIAGRSDQASRPGQKPNQQPQPSIAGVPGGSAPNVASLCLFVQREDAGRAGCEVCRCGRGSEAAGHARGKHRTRNSAQPPVILADQPAIS